MSSTWEDLWERNARWWQLGFTKGADPEYEEQILPLIATNLSGAKRVLDLGCGEGQVSRMAASLPGVDRVVGLDRASAQMQEAVKLDGGPEFARGAARALPFANESFDAVVACLVIEHVEDMDGAVGEVARVLDHNGVFLLLLNHPLLQTPGSGWIDDAILEEQYWRIGPYLVEDSCLEEMDKGVWIPFVHRPLSRYVNRLSDAGLFITRMEEPAPPKGFLARAEEYSQAATIPRLLMLRAEKLGAAK